MNVVKEKENLRKAIGGSMYKKCEMILKELEAEGKLKVWWDFNFPEKQKLVKRLKDILEEKVDEKYYLKEEQIARIRNSNFMQERTRVQEKEVCDTLLARDWKDSKCVRIGGIFDTETSKHQAGSIYDKNGLSPTIDTCEGGWRQPCIEQIEPKIDVIGNYSPSNHDASRVVNSEGLAPTVKENHGTVTATNVDYKIRKLTPLETWRLMGFTDEEFNRACYGKEIVYIEGDLKCNAKLKIVKEKQRHTDMETYVLCTTKDMSDTEIQKLTLTKSSILKELNENSLNVNIAIEILGEQELKECATSIIKCTDYTKMQNTLIKELDRHHMAIIELGKEGKQNTEKYMKIILGENCDQVKLYIISTLIEQIIKSKIYTYIHQQANIQGNIAILEDCRNNLNIMRLLNLKMEYITQKMSNSSLYKQARQLYCC